MNSCEDQFVEKDEEKSHYFQPAENANDDASTPSINANIPKYGKVIPNRVFVGGIDFKTTDEDLENYFSSFGHITHTKVVRDRAEVSKGFGFVTFEEIEDANKVREQEDSLYLHGKKLNIGPAIEKHQTTFPKDVHIPGPLGAWILHPRGYASYTHQNGITYFPPALPMLSSSEQQSAACSSFVPYSSNTNPLYAVMPNHNSNYLHPPYNGQTYCATSLRMPCNNMPISRQFIAPSATSYPNQRSVNVLTVPPTYPHQSYLLSKDLVANSCQASTIFYPQATPFNCVSPGQYVELSNHHTSSGSAGSHYEINNGNYVVPSVLQRSTASENTILTPPLTPEQQSKQLTSVNGHY